MGILNKLCVSVIQRLLSRNYFILSVLLFAGVKRGGQANEWWFGTPLLPLSLSRSCPKDSGGQGRRFTVDTDQSEASFLVGFVGERVCFLPFSRILKVEIDVMGLTFQKKKIVRWERRLDPWPMTWHLRWLKKFLLMASAIKNLCCIVLGTTDAQQIMWFSQPYGTHTGFWFSLQTRFVIGFLRRLGLTHFPI